MRTILKAKPIAARTKGEVRRLRHEGYVPLTLQHRGEGNLHLQSEAKSLDDFIRHYGEAALLDVIIEPEGVRQTAVVHDVQRDPLTHRLLQVTLQKVLRDEPIKAHIPLVLRGEPEAARLHTAIVQQNLETIEVRCLPADLPDHVAADISRLEPGDVLHVSDIPVPPNGAFLTPPNTVIASLATLNAKLDQAEEQAAEATVETEAEGE